MENGIIRPGHVLTHVAMAEIPKYEKLLFFTDAAVILLITVFYVAGFEIPLSLRHHILFNLIFDNYG